MYKKYRNHKIHHKNWVIFTLVFVTTSLLTSGLATFVVAQTKKHEDQGQVNIGVVNDTHVHFSNLEFAYDAKKENDVLFKDRISFDADPKDNSGRVQHDSDKLGREHRTVTLTGKVGPMTYINSCTYQFTIPQHVQDAIDRNYIELARPDGEKYDASKDYILAPRDIVTSKPDSNDEATFSVTCGFNWGSFFNYKNPCHYYDDYGDKDGGNKSDEQVVKERTEFRRVRYYGKDYKGEVATDRSKLPELKFTITLTAKTRLS